jgi:hypothetical protein
MPTIISGDGTITGLTATGISAVQNLPAGSVLQVVQVINSTTFSSSSTSYVTPTNMSVTITPTSVTSKILVLMRVMCSGSLAGLITLRGQLIRGATALDSGDSGATSAYSFINTRFVNYLDSPATTSATTYSYQFYGDGSTWYVNQTGFSANPASSQLTLMEIAG